MKLRIHAGSIRFRLLRHEVQALVEGSPVSETCPTQPVPLTYVLRPDPAIDELVSHSDGTRLTLSIPQSWLANWHEDSRVGFESKGSGIHLIIEKDFKCLHPSQPEDNAGCYDHPEANA
jgi:hypothetical protein